MHWQVLKKPKIVAALSILIVICTLSIGLLIYSQLQKPVAPLTAQQIATQYAQHQLEFFATPSATVTQATSSATASGSAVLSFEATNKLYGPCTRLPVLMYHHIENEAQAKQEGHAQLTVDTHYFRTQMQYLKDKNYHVIKMSDLINFFDEGTALPTKAVLLTFDDGYVDFNTDAWPVLQEFNYPATEFIPTGLLENPDYLTWNMVTEINSHGLVLMANHTWSHHSMAASQVVIQKEISTAQTQLANHNLDNPQVFAYPYGTTSPQAIKFLDQSGYKLAFTTKYGTTQCKGERLVLPRVRIGNAPLSSYGL